LEEHQRCSKYADEESDGIDSDDAVTDDDITDVDDADDDDADDDEDCASSPSTIPSIAVDKGASIDGLGAEE
jgi:hypothetical protein